MTISRAKKLIWFFIGLLFFSLALICFSSIFGITELIYPVKIDSAYVAAVHLKPTTQNQPVDTINPITYYSTPEQLGIRYEPFDIITRDSIKLKGWYFQPQLEETGLTILLIHDIQESKYSFLEDAKAFSERGFRVCMVDMRACGESDGTYFTMGTVAAQDISQILDSLYCRPETRDIAILGSGTGAAIGIQCISYNKRPVALVVQNCFLTLTGYFSRYAKRKWGILGTWFFPLMKRELERQMGFNSDSLNLQNKISDINTPSLFIAKAKESLEELKETHLLYESSPAEKKEFIFFRGAYEGVFDAKEQKEYYDRISAFINTSIPKTNKKTRFRKLVTNDHQSNH